MAALGLGLVNPAKSYSRSREVEKGKRVGMIGLDTGHSVAFTRSLNDPEAGNRYNGYKVVAAYPKGTEKIEAWKKRIPEFTKEVKNQGAQIVDSIDELLDKVDVVLLTCNDGNKHLEPALPVIKAGKRVFFDTGIVPVAHEETLEIFAFMQAAEESKIKGGISVDLESVIPKRAG